MYKYLIRPFLFRFNAESIHHFTMSLLQFWPIRFLLKTVYSYEHSNLERNLFGLTFKNPVGLAAGFDKNAENIDALADLGFGFIEIGTLTPKAQDGNPKPRLFRLISDDAIINRMGFNNIGVEAAVANLKRRKSPIIIGGNIGKNKVTENDDALNDYTIAFEALYNYVDYFTVNISSPNTPNLRSLQEKEPLNKLLAGIQKLNGEKETPKPVLLKIAPDLSNTQLDDILEIVEQNKLAGIIATNTTISRDELKASPETISSIGAGGLSGKPVTKRSTEVISYIHGKTAGRVPIIGVGGIFSAEDALEKINAGASLVQIYTGFIFEGPALLKKIKKQIVQH